MALGLSKKAHSPLSFLMMEESQTIRKMHTKILIESDHKVTAVENASMLTQLLKKELLVATRHDTGDSKYQFDVVMMGMMFRNKTGVEMTRHLRMLGFKGTIMIVSGNQTLDECKELETVGANILIPKPLTTHQLRIALEGILSKRLFQIYTISHA